jgi:hypothetical protein
LYRYNSETSSSSSSSASLWQRSACAHVIALNEIMHGATAAAAAAAGKPGEGNGGNNDNDGGGGFGGGAGEGGGGGGGGGGGEGDVDEDVLSAVRAVLEEYLSQNLWNLPTSFDDVQQPLHGGGATTTLATLRDNALLVVGPCTAVECS